MSRKRNVQVLVRFDRKEYEDLMKKVHKAGMSRETYIRHLVAGSQPKCRPPREYYDMMQQLYRIGGNLNQVAAKAHTLNVLDVQTYDHAVCEFRDVVRAFSREAHGVDKAMPDGNN